METPLTVEQVEGIARVCHEANRAYCATLGDTSQAPWDEAPEWQRESAIAGVRAKLEKPALAAVGQHAAWMELKLSQGWKYGPVKSPDAKTHPCMVPYRDLPPEQRRKDALFGAIVLALA